MPFAIQMLLHRRNDFLGGSSIAFDSVGFREQFGKIRSGP